ncbi:MAG TPA: response regulator transcription factor [Lachnospiraceae bacterium]|nr:response regulator transcription factor [Lachnospiraceae bacterium]
MTYKFNVLVIEDDININHFLTKLLTSHGYKVISATCGKEGLALTTSQCPDIIIIDVLLHDIDAIDIIHQVRTWSSNPIIVVSACTDVPKKVLALDSGADDYITKPICSEELLARIRTSIRHSNKLYIHSPLFIRPYYAKGLCLDFAKRVITLHNKIIHLTPIEYKIVSFLAQNSGKIMSYSSIMSNIWGPFGEENNIILRVNMANIRRKLRSHSTETKYIFTETGMGYRMLEDEPDSR